MSKLKFKIDDEGYLNVSEDGGCSWEAIGLVKGDASTEAGPEGPAGPCGAPGANGQDGQDGITPYISDNGTWVVGGVDTGIIAAGRNGEVDVEASDDITVVGTPSVTWRLENGKTFIKFHELKGESGDKITAEKSEGVTIIYVNNEEVAVINDGKTYHNGQWISIDETDAINCILKEGEGITIATDGTISCDIESLPSGNIGDVYYIDQENSNHVDPMQILTYDAFIENDDELNYLKTRSVTLDEIYNDWQAFGHLGDTNTTPATAEMQAEQANPKSFWTYNSGAKTMVCSKNSVTYLGFVDNKNFVDHYTLQAKLHSTDGDNDSISVIIAYYKDSQGKEYTLSAVRTRNNNEAHTIADYNLDGSLRPSSSKPLPMWAIVYNYKQVDSRLIASTNITGDTSDSWSKTTGTIVKIVRNGNNIQCSASPYGSTTIDSSSIINIDLDSIGILNVFKGKRQYGVGCFSQPASTFSNITIQLANVIYDMRDGSGWVYTATTWTKIANKLYDDFLVGRILNSQDFNKSYYIDVPGHNIKINDDNRVPKTEHELIYYKQSEKANEYGGLITQQLMYKEGLVVDTANDFALCKQGADVSMGRVFSHWTAFGSDSTNKGNWGYCDSTASGATQTVTKVSGATENVPVYKYNGSPQKYIFNTENTSYLTGYYSSNDSYTNYDCIVSAGIIYSLKTAAYTDYMAVILALHEESGCFCGLSLSLNNTSGTSSQGRENVAVGENHTVSIIAWQQASPSTAVSGYTSCTNTQLLTNDEGTSIIPYNAALSNGTTNVNNVSSCIQAKIRRRSNVFTIWVSDPYLTSEDDYQHTSEIHLERPITINLDTYKLTYVDTTGTTHEKNCSDSSAILDKLKGSAMRGYEVLSNPGSIFRTCNADELILDVTPGEDKVWMYDDNATGNWVEVNTTPQALLNTGSRISWNRLTDKLFYNDGASIYRIGKGDCKDGELTVGSTTVTEAQLKKLIALIS